MIPPGPVPSQLSRQPQTGAPFNKLPPDMLKLRAEFEIAQGHPSRRVEQQRLFGAQADCRINASCSPSWKRTGDRGYGEHGGHDGDKYDRIKRPHLE